MKTYTVCFSEPVCHKYIGDRFNRELKKWECDVECEEWNEALCNTSLRSVNVNIVNDEVEYSLFHIYAKLSTIAHYLNEGWCMGDDGHVGIALPYPIRTHIYPRLNW